MTLITENDALKALCKRLKSADFLTVDTEFMREKTYWPELCLIQIASDDEAAAVDPLARGIDLAPLFDLLLNGKQVKVFHAARQDLEIFHKLTGALPSPVFDTQVAAMVCGFGESAGYAKLVEEITGGHIDKSSRYFDWSRRPLAKKQLDYALSDVTYLRDIYRHLDARLEETGRADWLKEEMQILTTPATYINDPEEAWQRLKLRSKKPTIIAMAQAIAAWREEEAQQRNLPRGRVLRDDQIIELAASQPADAAGLGRVRGLSEGFARSASGRSLLKIIKETRGSKADPPPRGKRLRRPPEYEATLALLRVLLKQRCGAHDVAAKMVASSADLERLALEKNPDIPALKGWRRKIFGADALALKSGQTALAIGDDGVRMIPLDEAARDRAGSKSRSRA